MLSAQALHRKTAEDMPRSRFRAAPRPPPPPAPLPMFCKITMKVLTMQLNSITIMDLIAYGGAALGVIMAATQFRAGNVTLSGCLLIILLSADFFIPMRQLGSFFHVAMNGMAASEKIFRLLDLPETEDKTGFFPPSVPIPLCLPAPCRRFLPSLGSPGSSP